VTGPSRLRDGCATRQAVGFTQLFRRGRRAVTRPRWNAGAGGESRGGAVMLLAHVSDLHIGRDAATDRTARLLAHALEETGPAAVLVTGDVTHRGRTGELRRFERIFRRLLEAGRMIVVPGNHDRMSDDVARALMPAGRVDVVSRAGLHVVRLDSPGPHNRSLLHAHGQLTEGDIEAVSAALDRAPPGALALLALHHHLLPLPVDHLVERLSNLLGWPNAAELGLGARLLQRIRERCDLVLHGHRHTSSERVLGGARPLRILNAGSSTALGRVRLLVARGGRVATHGWLTLPARDAAWVGRALADRAAA
jgi:3',5'-cyclic AMP phosphodiesterase CpdA